jgi:transcriptional regulator with XRE-family HTH domain
MKARSRLQPKLPNRSSQSAVPAEIEVLKEAFGNQSAVADVLGVDRASVTRWLQGKDSPDLENEERIAGVRYVMIRLTRILKPQIAESWLKGINAHLDNKRPLDLLRDGRIAEVISAIEQMEAGSYA